jgi:hypothetical protein
MKTYLLLSISFLFCAGINAQKGDELLVYAVKGEVTAIFKQQETRVKIGKVLKQGTTLKTGKDASLTMICTKGKAISLQKEGSFPLSRWRDSCAVTDESITANYFKYIWQQMYAYSPERKEEMRRRNNMAVSRGENPGTGKKQRFTKLEFKKSLDTLQYDGDPFILSWTGNGYRGMYYFTLYDALGKDSLYTDSTRLSYIDIKKFANLLEPGTSYRWTVKAAAVPVSKKRVLNYVLPEEKQQLMDQLLKPLAIEEDSATVSFRIAYSLELRHYFSAAYQWYQQAAIQDPEMPIYRDQLTRFRNDYWIR